MLGVALSGLRALAGRRIRLAAGGTGGRVRRRRRRAEGLTHERAGIEPLLQTLRSQGQVCAAHRVPRCTATCSSWWPPTSKPTASSPTILAGHENDSGRHGGAAATARRTAPVGARRPRTGAAPLVSQHRRALGRRSRVARHHRTPRPNTPTSLRAALDQPPQTNEVGRSAALIGGLLASSDRIRFAGKAFRDRLQRRAESAGRPLPLPLSAAASGVRPIHRSPSTTRGRANCLPPGAAADRRTSRLRHRAAGRHRHRRGADAAELRLAGPAALGWTGCAARSRRPPGAGARCIAAMPPTRWPGWTLAGGHADRAVAFDHVAVPFAARAVRHRGVDRRDRGAGATRLAVRPPDAGTTPANTRRGCRVRGAGPVLARRRRPTAGRVFAARAAGRLGVGAAACSDYCTLPR